MAGLGVGGGAGGRPDYLKCTFKYIGTTPIIKVTIPVHLRFNKALNVKWDIPGVVPSYQSGPVLREADWTISIDAMTPDQPFCDM